MGAPTTRNVITSHVLNEWAPDRTSTQVYGDTMKLAVLLAVPIAAFGIAACGSTPTSVAPAVVATAAPATAAPTAAPTAVPTAVPAPASTSGMGDTTANPDSTFVCAFSYSENGSIIAYLTIAGDPTVAAAGCSAMTTPWQSVNMLPAQGYYAVPGCFATTNGVTMRIYTAAAGSVAITSAVCSSFLSSINGGDTPA
jgi:hypothetical protein